MEQDPDMRLPEDWEIDDYNQEKFVVAHMTVGCGCVFSIIVVFILCLFLCGCTTTKYVEVEKVRIDSTYITKHQRDSIWLHDSVFVKDKGDSVWVERWHTKYIEKQIHDTLIQATHDTIPVICEVEKEVPAQLSSWQKLLIKAGYLALAAFIACIIYTIIKIKDKISW